MHRRLRRITTLMVVAAFSLTGPLQELEHRHVNSGNPLSGAALTSHACGAKERHIPLDRIHQCAACAQKTQRVSTPFTSAVAIAFSGISPVGPPGRLGFPVVCAHLIPQKRGPPSG